MCIVVNKDREGNNFLYRKNYVYMRTNIQIDVIDWSMLTKELRYE